MSEAIHPFQVAVPQADIDDLRERLGRARWPDQIPDTGWDYGTNREYLKGLCHYWQHTYDWRTTEATINQWPQFLTTIDGQQVHFIHARSAEPTATPLLITHGWPGSVLEFMKIIGPLTDPVSHGGSADDAFHVVCPSIPGYAWSGPTTEPGWDISRVARAFDTLMRRLGYARYGAQGGDWGAILTEWLGHLVPEHLIGIHLNLVMAMPPSSEDRGTWTEDERSRLDGAILDPNQRGYVGIQGTRPQTLAYALADSPTGLAGWIVDKFRAWSDCGGDVETSFSKDEMLGNISAYWFTNTIGSSVRLYRESREAATLTRPRGRLSPPTACALFPAEMFRPVRRWADARYNVQQWSELPHGGHFAALEQPELFVTDLRSFFRSRS
ncbi:MAG: Epoxide hydrolase [Acidimicrobiia bacterium]|nr:Epoxide hydrolase [Acidimicrobiia bacterium]